MRFTGNGITNCYPDQVEDFISITVLRTVIECAVKGAIPQRVRIPPGNCRVWTPPKLQAFSESPLYLRTRRSRVRWIGSPRQRSIHVVKGRPGRGKSSSAAGGESVQSGTGADLYVRCSNVAANPNVTSGERAYRQGSDRPCAGLRWPRTANPASGQSLHLPSALYDAHPLWRTQKIWTVSTSRSGASM